MSKMTKSAIFRVAAFAATFLLLVAGFHAMILDHLPGVFNAPEEDLDFAWFVPLISVSMLYRDRRSIADSVSASSFAGVLFSLPFLFIGFLGVRGLQVRFELLAFVFLVIAAVWSVFGLKCAKTVAFPVLFLLFCMPLASYLSLLTVHLRLFASATSAAIVNAVGIDVVRQGNLITLPGVEGDGGPFAIDIANPCSGLRSVIALMALSLCYGYFSLPGWKRRIALFASSIPLAVLGNVVRIVSICIVARFSGAAFAQGFYHDFSGYVVFAVAIFFMMLVAGILMHGAAPHVSGDVANIKPPRPSGALPLSRGESREIPSPVLRHCPAVCVFILFAAVMWLQLSLPAPQLAEPPPVALPDVEGFSYEEIAPSVAETNILAGARIEKRRYTHDVSGFWFESTIVTSAANKGSLHRPELCLPSQGFQMQASKSLVLDGYVPWRVIPLAPAGGSQAALFAYTFVNQDGYRTSSHVSRILRDTWDRSFCGTMDRWAMTTVFVPSSDERVLKMVLDEIGGGRWTD